MNNSLSHRGPDDHGTFFKNTIGLGHRRLSIIDLSSAGHQPMTTKDGRFTIIYNGELYNYKEIKKELINYEFVSTSDTEVILASFVQWGAQCVNRFNGMFAFAIWDDKEKSLFVARDRLGIKPLYYFEDDQNFIFSSEIRALLESGLIPRALNLSCIPEYLAYQTIHAPNTIVKNVKMLEPGCSITVTGTSSRIKKYWNIFDYLKKNEHELVYEEIKSEVRKKLLSSVEKRMVADIPFGAFLSGGIDSSIIVALMSQVSKNPIKTFSVSFEYSKFNETEHALTIAKMYRTDHHELLLTSKEILSNIETALASIDHPTADGINTYMISEKTKREGITMALSGLGGDELFAGYDYFGYYKKLQHLRYLSLLPLSLRKLVGNRLRKAKRGTGTEKINSLLLEPAWDFENIYPIFRQVYFDDQIHELMSGETIYSNQVREITADYKNEKYWKRSDSDISRISIAEISTYMQNVLLRDVDQMSMAHALEVRVPFLDHELVEFVLGIGDKQKYHGRPKQLLIDSAKDLIPDTIYQRTKMGFVFPWDIWMKNELSSFCDNSIKKLAYQKIFKEEALNNIWIRFLSGDLLVNWPKIWSLVVLQNWMENNKVETSEN